MMNNHRRKATFGSVRSLTVRGLMVVSRIIATLLFSVASAYGATIEVGGDPSLNCVITIEGALEAGDAKKFRDVLTQYVREEYPDYQDVVQLRQGDVRVCLDSPGGSIAEALSIGDTLVFAYKMRLEGSSVIDFARVLGTAIPDGAICHSACAFVFMAGGYFSSLGPTPNTRDPDRVLHIGGELGFHAPDLRVDTEYPDQETIRSAFSAALEVVEKIDERRRMYRISADLFGRFVSTPPDKMFLIETVGQAASWKIALAGVPLIEDPSAENIMMICRNQMTHSYRGITWKEMYDNPAPVDVQQETVPLFRHDPIGLTMARPTESSPVRSEDTATVVWIEYEGCKGTFNKSENTVQFEAVDDEFSFVPHGDLRWAMYPPYVTLDDLLKFLETSPNGAISGSTYLRPVFDFMKGTCAYYDESANMIAAETCTSALSSRESADMSGLIEVMTVGWADGMVLKIDNWEKPAFGTVENLPDGWSQAGKWIWEAESPGDFSSYVPSDPLKTNDAQNMGFGLDHCFFHEEGSRYYCVNTGVTERRTVPFWER